MAELNTIIQLRNATSEQWNTDAGLATPLRKGEGAVEILDNGKVKIKFGTSDSSTFGNSAYFGGADAQIYQSEPLSSENADDDVTIINGLVPEGTELAAGDIAIVKRYVKGTSGAISYTSYVYDPAVESDVKWVAMDGNYSASNVFFKNDITLAGSYTSVGNVALSEGTLSAAGKSLEDVMTSIFTKEISNNLQNTAPTATINATTNKYLLVGAASTAQTATMTLNKGKYDNGYGYVASKNEENIEAGTVATTVVTNDGTGVEANEYTLDGTTQTSNSFTISSATKTTAPSAQTIKGKISYKNAGNPVSNLKKIYPAQALADGTTAEVSATLNKWYIPFYHGFTVDADVIADPANITATQLQALATANMKTYRFSGDAASVTDANRPAITKFVEANAYDKKKVNTATASGSWRQYFLAYPKDWGYVMSDAKDSNNLTCGINEAADVTINYNGVDVVYKVYYINNKAAYDTVKILWTI